MLSTPRQFHTTFECQADVVILASADHAPMGGSSDASLNKHSQLQKLRLHGQKAGSDELRTMQCATICGHCNATLGASVDVQLRPC